MNILVTGGNGFIGRSLRSSTLMLKHKIIFTSRKQDIDCRRYLLARYCH